MGLSAITVGANTPTAIRKRIFGGSLLNVYCSEFRIYANTLIAGWGRYMEWMYPVEVKITNKSVFNVTGAVEAAATL